MVGSLKLHNFYIYKETRNIKVKLNSRNEVSEKNSTVRMTFNQSVETVYDAAS